MTFPKTHVDGEVWDGAAVTDLEQRVSTAMVSSQASLLTPYNIHATAYDPSGNVGVAGHDSGPALRAVIANAVTAITSTGHSQTVYIGPGIYDLITGGTKPALVTTADPNNPTISKFGAALPVNLATNCWLNIVCDNATFRLNANCLSVFIIDKLADYDVFQQVRILGGPVIDANNVVASQHILIGSVPISGTTKQRYLSFQDLYIEKPRIINVATAANSAGQSTQSQIGIFFEGDHNGPLESTQTFAKRIVIDRPVQFGGDGVCHIYGTAANRAHPGGINHWHDDIYVLYPEWYATSAGVSLAQTGVYLVGGGFGGKIRLIHPHIENSGDDAIEVGPAQDGLIDASHLKDSFLEHILLRNTHQPLDPASARWVIRAPYFENTSALHNTSLSYGCPVRAYMDDGVYLLTPSGGFAGGTFTFGVVLGSSSASTTSVTATGIAFNASAAGIATAVQAALVAAGFASATVSGTGGPINTTPVTLTFNLAGQAMAKNPFTNAAGLTGGSNNAISVVVSVTGGCPVHGEIVIEDPTWHCDSMKWSNTQRTDWFVAGLDQPVRKVEIIRPVVNITNYNYDGTTAQQDISLCYVRGPDETVWPMDVATEDWTVNISGIGGDGAGHQAKFHGVLNEGFGSRLTVDGMEFNNPVWTNGAGPNMTAISKNGSQRARLLVRRLNPITNPGAVGAITGLRVYSTGTASHIAYSESDFSRPNVTLVPIDLVSAGINAAKVTLGPGLINTDGTPLGDRIATAADFTMLTWHRQVVVTSTAAARTITLPAANSVPVGRKLTVVDESNAAGTNNITLTRAGSDTWLGGGTTKVISTNGGKVDFYSTGSVWIPVPALATTVVDVRDYGAKLDGTTDDSTAWFNALAAGAAQQRPVFHSGGVSVVSQAGAVLNGTNGGSFPAAVVLPLGCPGIIGTGIGGDVFSITDVNFVNGPGSQIRLKAGSNCDVLQTANFAALTGVASPSVYTIPSRFTIKNLMLDGNYFSGNNTNASACVLRVYGRSFLVEHMVIQNGSGLGIWSEGRSGGYDEQATWADILATANIGDGFTANGPHDSYYGPMTVSKNGRGVVIGQNGVHTAFVGNEMFVNVHAWGSTLRPDWILATNAGFVNCVSDGTAGAGSAGVRVLGSGNKWKGGFIYGSNLPGEIAIEYGDGSTVVTCQGNEFDAHFFNYAKGSVLVRYRTNATVNRNRLADACAHMGGNVRYAAGEGFGLLSGSHTFPQGTITLTTSTAAWAASGQAYIGDGSNTTVVNYAGISGSTLTGCTGGTGTFAGGSVAFQVAASAADAWDIVDPDNLTAFGLVQDAQAGYTRLFNNAVTVVQGDFDVATVGKGLKVKEGSNCKQGTATLGAGTVTVANTSVTANSRILLTSNVDGGTPGWLRVSARSVGVSFTITSSSGTDTSTVAFQIFEPG